MDNIKYYFFLSSFIWIVFHKIINIKWWDYYYFPNLLRKRNKMQACYSSGTYHLCILCNYLYLFSWFSFIPNLCFIAIVLGRNIAIFFLKKENLKCAYVAEYIYGWGFPCCSSFTQWGLYVTKIMNGNKIQLFIRMQYKSS